MIDDIELRAALKDMKPHQKLYELVKGEIVRRGHWKPKARGKSFNKGYDSRRHGL